jgi:hypothetical protein
MKRAGANRRHGEQEGNPAGVLKGHAQVWLADWRASDDAVERGKPISRIFET